MTQLRRFSVLPLVAALTTLLLAVCTTAMGNAAESPKLRDDVTQLVMVMDGVKDKTCRERKVVKTEVKEKRADGTPGVERWTLDRCGKLVNYRVRFTPNSKGGVDFDAQLEK